ncbi:MAG TPA: hypothetical protein VMS32_08095 [Verrucomicrobiae bacterium]|jgi:hypothetical protein|nr:hypothetical protein [Verrucomicrobiae bacterium]
MALAAESDREREIARRTLEAVIEKLEQALLLQRERSETHV